MGKSRWRHQVMSDILYFLSGANVLPSLQRQDRGYVGSLNGYFQRTSWKQLWLLISLLAPNWNEGVADRNPWLLLRNLEKVANLTLKLRLFLPKQMWIHEKQYSPVILVCFTLKPRVAEQNQRRLTKKKSGLVIQGCWAAARPTGISGIQALS